MKLDFKDLPAKLVPLLEIGRRYATFGFIILMLGLFGFLVARINQLNGATPSEEAIAEKLQTVQRPKFDEATLDKIKELEDESVQVKTLFDSARKNPFKE